jgi:hypothetical protein
MSFDQAKRRRTYVLRGFPDFPGLTVHCRKPGFRALRELGEAVLVLGEDLSGDGLSGDAKLAAWEPLFTALQRSVLRWDLIDEGRAVPVADLPDQDWEFLLTLTREWYRRVVLRIDDSEPPHGGNDPEPDVTKQALGEPGIDEEWLSQLPVTAVEPDEVVA